MKMLTYSGMASARLKANKRGYLSLAIGVFLSIFLITTFVFGVYGIVNAQLHNRQEKVGVADMVVLDNEIMNDEKLMELGAFDQLGHAYVTGSVEGSSLHLGYYDSVGIELLCLSHTAGRLPENPGEIALEPSSLEVLELSKAIGDTVELSVIPVDGVAEARTFTIVGFLPEKSQHLDVADKPGVNQFPAIVTCETEPTFATGRVGIHRVMGLQAGVSLGMALGRFWERYMRPELVTAMYGLTITAKQTVTYSAGEMLWADRELMDLISMAAVLAGALILSCGIGISGAMDGVLSKRREEIGVLRALGATRRQIRRMFGRENLILALLVSPHRHPRWMRSSLGFVADDTELGPLRSEALADPAHHSFFRHHHSAVRLSASGPGLEADAHECHPGYANAPPEQEGQIQDHLLRTPAHGGTSGSAESHPPAWRQLSDRSDAPVLCPAVQSHRRLPVLCHAGLRHLPHC